MRVLLAVPPGVEGLEVYRTLGLRAPPLGLAWVAAVLEAAGHKVRIVDSPTEGIDMRSLMGEVKSWHPDLVGLTATTPMAYKAYETARAIKEYDRDLPVIMGGPHATFMYEEALKSGVDVVVRGEGEYTMLELVSAIERSGPESASLRPVRGIAFRDGDRIVVTPDRSPIRNLDELPPPARHLLPMDKYTLFGKPVRVIHVMASRGCPFGCIFCTTSYFWGRYVRYRSARRVAEEIEDAVSKYKTNIIMFTDDELLLNKKFVTEFLGELKARRLDISFSCGSRVDSVSRELLFELRRHGCASVYFGVESGSQETLDRIGKGITLEQAARAFRWAKEAGLAVVGSFILGFPWETPSDMRQTVKFAIKLDPTYAQFTVATPYPGTPLYYRALREGLIEDWNWEHWTTARAVMRGYGFTREQAQRMLKWAYVRYYCRLSKIVEFARRRWWPLLREVLLQALAPTPPFNSPPHSGG
ncbi:MAG: B12-binding domain-containing radical SAM protein [Thermoproteaceae archaeon]|nr:B12-binding domain-containing radical SAM protein [Thermoproteaceae archaeon]